MQIIYFDDKPQLIEHLPDVPLDTSNWHEMVKNTRLISSFYNCKAIMINEDGYVVGSVNFT